jgi:hypothetical protein
MNLLTMLNYYLFYPASLRNVGCSTQVHVRSWNNAWKGTWGLPPRVKLERRDMTYTVSMWRKTQNKLLILKKIGGPETKVSAS